MDLHLSEESARYLETQPDRAVCRTPSEFVERLLRPPRQTEATAPPENHAWLLARETAAAKLWDNDADAHYDPLESRRRP
jgi:hypothetical protein